MDKINELVELIKVKTGMVEEVPQKKQVNIAAIIVTVFAIIGVVCAAAYALYRYFGPMYFEDFEDDYEEDFDDDFFEDEEELEVPVKKEEKEEVKEDEAKEE